MHTRRFMAMVATSLVKGNELGGGDGSVKPRALQVPFMSLERDPSWVGYHSMRSLLYSSSLSN